MRNVALQACGAASSEEIIEKAMSPLPPDLEALLRLTRTDLYDRLVELYEELASRDEELSRRTLERAQLQQVVSELTELSQRDSLTGLLNRRALNERLVEEMSRARRYGAPLCLMMIDIDHFKQVNDRYGHAVGDVAIGHVARLLARDRRVSDILARYGGEELVVLLPHTPLEGAAVLAERLRVLVEQTPYRTGAGQALLTISLGVALFDRSMQEPKELLEAADRAMYCSKRAGRNRVTVG